jgi:hypothetical protein
MQLQGGRTILNFLNIHVLFIIQQLALLYKTYKSNKNKSHIYTVCPTQFNPLTEYHNLYYINYHMVEQVLEITSYSFLPPGEHIVTIVSCLKVADYAT